MCQSWLTVTILINSNHWNDFCVQIIDGVDCHKHWFLNSWAKRMWFILKYSIKCDRKRPKLKSRNNLRMSIHFSGSIQKQPIEINRLISAKSNYTSLMIVVTSLHYPTLFHSCSLFHSLHFPLFLALAFALSWHRNAPVHWTVKCLLISWVSDSRNVTCKLYCAKNKWNISILERESEKRKKKPQQNRKIYCLKTKRNLKNNKNQFLSCIAIDVFCTYHPSKIVYFKLLNCVKCVGWCVNYCHPKIVSNWFSLQWVLLVVQVSE